MQSDSHEVGMPGAQAQAQADATQEDSPWNSPSLRQSTPRPDAFQETLLVTLVELRDHQIHMKELLMERLATPAAQPTSTGESPEPTLTFIPASPPAV